MSSPSLDDRHVHDWLDAIEQETPHAIDPALPCSRADFHLTNLKRKISHMDDTTPIAKRQRNIDFPTPLTSARSHETNSQDARSSTSAATSRSRSSSPRKRKHQLQVLDTRILFRERHDLRRHKADFEANVPCFERLLEAIRISQSKLPLGLEDFLRSRDDDMIPVTYPPFSNSDGLEAFNDLAKSVGKLSDDIDLCIRKEVIEDEWCHRLVYPMLELARARMSAEEKVEIATVKGIDVSPQTLLPSIDGHMYTKQRVDYALCSRLDDTTQLATILPTRLDRSLCQSVHPRLWDHVVFSHIEVKQKLDTNEADVQLAVWASAGFKKIREFMDRRPKDDTYTAAVQPLWCWAGQLLHLSVAIMQQSDEICIYKLADWDLQKDAELVKALVCLTKVMDWAMTDYLVWFKKLIQYD